MGRRSCFTVLPPADWKASPSNSPQDRLAHFCAARHSLSSPQKHAIRSHSPERVLIGGWTKITPPVALRGVYSFTKWWEGRLALQQMLLPKMFQKQVYTNTFTSLLESFRLSANLERKPPRPHSPKKYIRAALPFDGGSLVAFDTVPDHVNVWSAPTPALHWRQCHFCGQFKPLGRLPNLFFKTRLYWLQAEKIGSTKTFVFAIRWKIVTVLLQQCGSVKMKNNKMFSHFMHTLH